MHVYICQVLTLDLSECTMAVSLLTKTSHVTYTVGNNLLCVFFSRTLGEKAKVKGIFFLTLHF